MFNKNIKKLHEEVSKMRQELNTVIKQDELFKKIQEIRDELNSSIEEGKQNDSPEMFGFYNGVIFTLSMIYNQEPEYLSAPDEWDEDIKAKQEEEIKKKKTEKKEKKLKFSW